MPCWYYDRKDLQNTPSIKDGISPETEARYRRDGARFIIDAGAKMGLRYDTCATGVVYFHRFYMFHSFLEFPRCVTAACCLFLAGKVEETPKKCKDLIKIAKPMLTEAQFATFKDDPKEEIMTLERILLQTIKFDLMVEHPYAYLLKFAKLIKGDKAKVQKLVQMSWTFINDSLCTTLSLQWEPEVIAIALMYLASRLSKFEINDWQAKPVGYRGKWFEFFVEDINLDLLEDICHQVLDLYSKPQKSEAVSPIHEEPSFSKTPNVKTLHGLSAVSNVSTPTSSTQQSADSESSILSDMQQSKAINPINPVSMASWQKTVPQQSATNSQQFSHTNPYVATGMYSSSFMDKEGSQSIQSLVDGQTNSSQYVKGLTQSQPFQQTTGQGFSVPATYAYQQPVTTFAGTLNINNMPPGYASSNLPVVTNFQNFPQGVGAGSYTYQDQTSQGKVTGSQSYHLLYPTNNSPGNNFNNIVPNNRQQNWR